MSPLGEVRPEDAFDVDAANQWLAQRIPGLTGVPKVMQFRGGASNLTYLLTYPDRELVLRRPPHGTKAASAHDMGREVRVQTRLRPYFALVPEVFAFCEDPAVIGSEFYVMARVPGTVLGADLPAGMTLSREQAQALGNAAIDGLADLHSVDVEAAGLTDLGKGPGYVERQISGWSRRYRAAHTDDVPSGEDVMRWLDENRPEDVATRLIHGDWKLDNMVIDFSGDQPRILAALDWEMATVGDPLMDLGASMAYWITDDDDAEYQLFRRQPTNLPGMPSRTEAVNRYLQHTGLPLADWTFYEVYGLFRLAVIAQQIWARYRAGQTTNPAFKVFGPAVTILVNRSAAVIGAAGA